MDTPSSMDHMPALTQLCKASCSCRRWASAPSERSPEGLFSNDQLLTDKPNSQAKVCSQTQWQCCVTLSPQHAGGAEEEWQHSVGKPGRKAPHLPQGFASGLPALHDLTASELLGASSTPPRILPAQLPNSALPASPGNPGNGRHRNISAHWRGSLEAQIWRDRQKGCTSEHKHPPSTR